VGSIGGLFLGGMGKRDGKEGCMRAVEEALAERYPDFGLR
jgi:hypothetical protein